MTAILAGPMASERTDKASPHALLSRYDGRAPRYTSFPTAAQFTDQIGAERYQGWLAALDPAKPISLYVHVPFCERLCWFCGCNTRVVRKRDLISRYVETLRAELALLEQVLPGRLPVSAIHLGGGTPSLLSRDDLVALFSTLRHVFKVRPAAEISVEADPATLSKSWLVAAAFHGVTRLSLGVQDLDPQVQAAVNRSETFEQIAAAVGWAREAGMSSINLDLMYGLPRQTVEGVRKTLAQVLTLKPDRIALFGYAHVPWMKPHQNLISASELPSAGERLDQALAGAAMLKAAGYVEIGLDHFARPDDALATAARSGEVRRNFQGYTTDACETLIGIGASSISRTPFGLAQNETQELAWQRSVESGTLRVAKGVLLTAEDRFRGEVIETLMCEGSVDLDEVCLRHEKSVRDLDEECEALERFVGDGVIVRQGARYTLTQEGRPFVRTVCTVFDPYLRQSGGRHSLVV